MKAKTADLIDAAMCAWEHVLNELDKATPKHERRTTGSKRARITMQITVRENKWDALRASRGMAALRDCVACLAPAIHEAYTIAERAGYDDCFDWDFVPAFIERATDDNCILRGNWRAIAREIATAPQVRT